MAIVKISSSMTVAEAFRKKKPLDDMYTSDGKYCLINRSIYDTSGFGKLRSKSIAIDIDNRRLEGLDISIDELMRKPLSELQQYNNDRLLSHVWTGVDNSRFFNPFAKYSIAKKSFKEAIEAKRASLPLVAGALLGPDTIACVNAERGRELNSVTEGLAAAFKPRYPEKKVVRGVLSDTSAHYPGHYFIGIGHLYFIGPKAMNDTLHGRLLASPESLMQSTYKVGSYKFASLAAAYAYMEEALEFVEATTNLGHLVLVRDPNSNRLSPVVRSKAVPLLTRYKGMYYKGKGNEAVFTFPSGANSSRFEKDLRQALPNIEVKHI